LLIVIFAAAVGDAAPRQAQLQAVSVGGQADSHSCVSRQLALPAGFLPQNLSM
jgi:hypothetical protein